MSFYEEFCQLYNMDASIFNNSDFFAERVSMHFIHEPNKAKVVISLNDYEYKQLVYKANSITLNLKAKLIYSMATLYPEISKEEVAEAVEAYILVLGVLHRRMRNDLYRHIEETIDTKEMSLSDPEKVEYYIEHMRSFNDYEYALAECYEEGRGVKKDLAKALNHYSHVASTNDNAGIIANAKSACVRIVKDNPNFFSEQTKKLYIENVKKEKTEKTESKPKARDIISQADEPKTEDGKRLKTENIHLAGQKEKIGVRIDEQREMLFEIDTDTSWMDRDQLFDWRQSKEWNKRTEAKIDELFSLKQSPYYGRIDVKTDDASTESFYVGEKDFLPKDNNSEFNVYSPWSNIGKLYRQKNILKASLDGVNCDVCLRRRIQIKNGTIVEDGIKDEYKLGMILNDIPTTDPFLKRILEERKRTVGLANIIRTIQKNQNDIVEEDKDRNIIVQGCAGSGKTQVLLHRLANLDYNYGANKGNGNWEKNTRIITPNVAFKRYLADLAADLGIERIAMSTLTEFFLELIQRYMTLVEDKETKVVRYDKNQLRWFREHIIDRCVDDYSWSQASGAAEFLYSASFATEFNNLISSDLGDFIQICKNSISLTNSILVRHGYKVASPSLALFTNMVIYFNKVRKKSSLDERFICVDEAQDIPERCLLVLNELSGGHCKFNIYGDMAQRTERHINSSGWDGLVSGLGAVKYNLNENFRNAAPIVQFYNEKLNRRPGDVALGLDSGEVYNCSIAEVYIQALAYVDSGDSVAFITNNPDSVMKELGDMAVREYSHGKIAVLSVLEAKGLEFDTVFVDDQITSINEKYIAYTRGISNLIIVRM